MELLQILTEPATEAAVNLYDRLTSDFFIRLAIDIAALLVLIRLIYFPVYKNREFFFTYFIFNIVIFFVTYLLNKVEISMGAAFGLFAVFSMLRYRTEGISMKDMTYLFLAIAMGLITAVAKGGWDQLILLNAIILAFTFLLESNLFMKREFSKLIQYENIEMIKPEFRERLVIDLETRTGIKINRITINKVDFLRDTAMIRIYYYE